MKREFIPKLNTTRKKVGVIALIAAFVISVGSISAFASGSPFNTLLAKVQNGIGSYSTDGGKTWSDKLPDGVVQQSGKDGKLTTSNGTPSKSGEGNGILTKVENGIQLYSTDGGKTWSDKAPDGVDVTAKKVTAKGDKTTLSEDGKTTARDLP